MINRWAFYGLTVLSCALLAGIFISRDQIWPALGISAVALLYVVRGVLSSRNERQAHRAETVETMAQIRTSSERKAVLAELRDTRNHLRGARQRSTLLGVLIAIAAVWTYPTSLPIAFVISAFLLPIGFMIVKHSRAISIIERGLTERGLSFQ